MFSVFKNINNFAGKSKILDGVAIFCASYLVYLIIFALFVEAIFFHSRGIFVYPLLSGFCAAFVFNEIVYIFYKEKRPAEFRSTNVLIKVPKNPSFPSQHASFIFGMSFYLFFYSAPLAVFFIILSCLVGIARVFCGVHWFRDILAGALVGLASSYITFTIITYIR